MRIGIAVVNSNLKMKEAVHHKKCTSVMPKIKRSLLLIALSFGILLIFQLQIHLPIVTGTIEKVTWKTYTAPGSLFTIEYPSKWEPRNATFPSGPIDVQFVYDGGDNNLYDDSFAYVEISSSPHSSYSTSREMIENDTAGIKYNDTADMGSRLEQGIECDTYIVNGIQGCSVIALTSYTQGVVSQKILVVDAVDNKTGIEYSILLAASGDVFEFFKPVFDHMVNSFRLSPNAFI